MVIPCIDLMDGKVVQLIQGREKALEGEQPLVMLEKFSRLPPRFRSSISTRRWEGARMIQLSVNWPLAP